MTDDPSDLPAGSGERGGLPVPAGEAGRRFGDEEVADILRRAASQEARSNLPAPHDPTLDDLVAAAEEAGMDGAAVRRAAAVRALPESGTQAWLFGGQSTRTVQGALEGPIPEDPGPLARAAEYTVGRSGSVMRSKPGTWIWESGGMESTRIELREEGGGTSLMVHGSRGGTLALTYMTLLVGVAAVSGSFGLFGAVAASMGPLASLLGLFGVPLLLTRLFFSRGDGRSRDRLEHLAMEVIRVAEETGASEDPGTKELPGPTP